MGSCDAMRRLLSHVAEGEVAPGEAMSVARHLADCTACKIVLARERRLARMLEQELQDLPVGEEFVQSVMATLPQGPPPGERKSERRRGLRLAAFAGFLGAGTLLVSQFLPSGLAGGTGLGLPTLNLEAASQSLEGLAGLVRLAVMALEAVASLPVDVLRFNWAPELFAATASAAALAVGAGSALFALAAGTLVRTTR